MSKSRTRRLRLAPAFAVLVLLTAPLPLHAQAFGRIVLTVEDEAGEPVEGVKVTMVCAELTQFHEEGMTDGKGRVQFSVVDATHPYQLSFEKEGYLPFESEVKLRIRDTTRTEITLFERGASASPPRDQPASAPPPGASLTPAQETFNEGVSALKEGDVAAAKAKFLAALELDPKLAAAHSGLAGIYIEEGNPEAALAAVDRLFELQEPDARGLRIRYQAHQALGNEKEAKQALAALKDAQEGGEAAALIYNEGVAALRVGDREAAKARFEEALQLDPELGAAVSALAIVYLNDGEFQRAAELAEQLLAKDPGDLQALRVRYDAYRLLGDTAKEQEAFEALAAADPEGAAQFLYEAGAKLFDQNQMEPAANLLARARELTPDHPDVLYRLGLAYVNLDRKAEAAEVLERFLQVAPDHPEAQLARDMLGYLKGS